MLAPAADPMIEAETVAEFGRSALDTFPRTEIQVVADTAWALLAAGAIDGRSWSQAQIRDLLGVSEEQLREARRRHLARGRLPLLPGPRDACSDEGSRKPVELDRDRLGRPISRRSWAAGRDGQKRCPRCREWKVVAEEFDRRSAKDPRPRALCRPCWADYQHERYLRVDATPGGAAAAFLIEDDDPCCGQACPICTTPLEAGQLASIEGPVAHDDCRKAASS